MCGMVPLLYVRTVLQEKELFLRQLRQMDLHDPMIRAAAAENVKVLY
jgi:hypothetical protein